jgi:hypothetical protein
LVKYKTPVQHLPSRISLVVCELGEILRFDLFLTGRR